MDVLEDVGSDNGVKICIHKIEDKIDITVVFGSNDILQSNDIFMTAEFLQEYNLAERSLRIGSILESIKVFLNGNNFFGPLIDGFPDYTVCSLSWKKNSTKSPQVRSRKQDQSSVAVAPFTYLAFAIFRTFLARGPQFLQSF